MTIDQPSRMATAILSPLLTAALVLGIVSEHSFAAEGSDSDRGFANSPAVTLGLEKSGIDPSEIATYSQFAESLLADATARVTAYGDGNVPAYAEYLKDAFIEGGFDAKDIQILPLDETFYFGRGVLDNKFDVSMLTTLFVWLKAQGFVPNRDLIIAFTGDEESLQNTVQDLTNNHRNLIDAE